MFKSYPSLTGKPDEETLEPEPAARRPILKIVLIAGSVILIAICIIMAVVLAQKNGEISTPSESLQPSTPSQILSPEPVSVEPRLVRMFADTPFYNLAQRAQASPRLSIGVLAGIVLTIIAVAVTLAVIFSRTNEALVGQDAVIDELKDQNQFPPEDQQPSAQKYTGWLIGGVKAAVLLIVIIIVVILKIRGQQQSPEQEPPVDLTGEVPLGEGTGTKVPVSQGTPALLPGSGGPASQPVPLPGPAGSQPQSVQSGTAGLPKQPPQSLNLPSSPAPISLTSQKALQKQSVLPVWHPKSSEYIVPYFAIHNVFDNWDYVPKSVLNNPDANGNSEKIRDAIYQNAKYLRLKIEEGIPRAISDEGKESKKVSTPDFKSQVMASSIFDIYRHVYMVQKNYIEVEGDGEDYVVFDSQGQFCTDADGDSFSLESIRKYLLRHDNTKDLVKIYNDLNALANLVDTYFWRKVPGYAREF